MHRFASLTTLPELSILELLSSFSPPVSHNVIPYQLWVQSHNPHLDAFDRYRNATGAVIDPETHLLQITPVQFANLKSLFFTIGGRTFELTANAQIWPRALNGFLRGKSDNIYLVVNDIGESAGGGLDFINGYTFLERFYTVFDTTNSRVGFATTSFTTANSN
jgi:cathepsin E